MGAAGKSGNRLLLHVEGKLPEDGDGSKTNLFFLCDDDSESGNWLVTGTHGLAKVRCIMIEGRRVWGRSLLAVWPIFCAGRLDDLCCRHQKA